MSSAVEYHLGKFPPKNLDLSRLITLVGPANAAVARYDGLLAAIPNPRVLLSPLMTQEAVLSSQIEGTQATMGEVLRFEAEGNSPNFGPEKRNEIGEVLNYRKAVWRAESLLETLPFGNRMLKETHEVLLSGVRGEGKAAGEYRRVPVWIGKNGTTKESARFIPASAETIPELMSNWEKYVHGESPDLLIQLAIAHAEFEAIHPFLDGNGRLGRMTIPLILWQKGLIRAPYFYMSQFLETHRIEYYDRLLEVSRSNDWTGWCVFFLNGIRAQAEINIEKANKITRHYAELKQKFLETTHSQYAIPALDWIFQHPIFKSMDFTATSQIPEPSIKRILSLLRKQNIIKVLQEPIGRRAGIYAAWELLNIAEGHNIF